MQQHLPRFFSIVEFKRIDVIFEQIVKLGMGFQIMCAPQHMGQLFGKNEVAQTAAMVAAQAVELLQHAQRPGSQRVIEVVQNKHNRALVVTADQIYLLLQLVKGAYIFG